MGSYLANNYAANTLFMTRLHDRLGETQYTDMLTGEKKVTSLWMRNVGAHTRFNDGSGQLKTRINSYVLQLGGDLAQWSTDGLDRWHIGAMAGYANSQNRTLSSVSDYHSVVKSPVTASAFTAPGMLTISIGLELMWIPGCCTTGLITRSWVRIRPLRI
ncbi:autotransporter MisL [Salmonella enterica subsp. enterica]|uniref:Autotransporter MisL n=1 Tax=Salmonella enterica I TaxID=59201 RepID=A0A379UX54_SALET|nr:autotransporter MisL [Salmonella enterica subsp. enterica]